jgi:AcrR family transcriptional regulator
MEPREKRQQVVRDAKIDVILKGAWDAFSKLGYHQTRLEDIAHAAGFSKTALYYYYENKEEIFMDLVIREGGKVLEAVRKRIGNTDNTLDAIEQYARGVLAIFGEHFNLMMGMMDFEAGIPPNPAQFHNQKEKMALMKETVQSFQALTAGVIGKGRECGEVTVELDDTIVSEYINSILRGIMFRWFKNTRVDDVESEIARFRTFLKPLLMCDKVNTTMNHSNKGK